MIGDVYNETIKYISHIPKEERKKIGQFFTQPLIAEFMANLTVIKKESIRVLDAGAGSGILTSAICEKCLKNSFIKNIEIVLYENNETVLPILNYSLDLIKNTMENKGININYIIVNENFIIDNANFWNGSEDKNEDNLFDIIISNPPYKKIRKDAEEAMVMKDIVHGQPNTYFLFMAMCAKLLKKDGEMVFINPRSFTSGAYFKKFRQWFLRNVQFTDIHLFQDRSKVFKSDKVLQETLILKAKKTSESINTINITTSNDSTFTDMNRIAVSKEIMISNNTDHSFILIPANNKDLETIGLINSWKHTLLELGFKLSTGKVVDFRSMSFLSNEPVEKSVPLLWPCNFYNNEINHPIDNEKYPQYIINNEKSKSLMIDNKDYILVKRLTSKEETKRIQCALYLKEDFSYKVIGVENHLNYLYKVNNQFNIEELYGLFTILNSTYVDNYYRILNGSTQVNAGEINSIPIPSLDIIKDIGLISSKQEEITVEFCNNIIKEFFINKNKKLKNVI